ncbi:uncharacterized protein G2W53_031300 [Senna tora]|uniref:Uncharacterized protein n=1 Tax=Senna tora TaxID=362788 RepID=A0A834T904_9FABA|nr:uncharacterized protein G2W53_031300 [Senna tora]
MPRGLEMNTPIKLWWPRGQAQASTSTDHYPLRTTLIP